MLRLAPLASRRGALQYIHELSCSRIPLPRQFASPVARCRVRLNTTISNDAVARGQQVPAASLPIPHAARADSNTKKRKWLKWLIGALIFLPVSKLLWALSPLWTSDGRHPIKDIDKLKDLLSVSKREKLAQSWGWLISEASDRLIRDLYIALLIVLDYVKHGKTTEDWSEIHQRGADKLLRLCEVNKGIYVKLGQHVGQLDYLLPAEYVNTLKILTHAAPRDNYEQVKSVIAEEFNGKTPEELFDDFDPVPIASASLAQVHVARLKGTNTKVAVKVQHAGLRETATADIYTVYALVHVVNALFPKFDYEWLAEEIRTSLPCELDFSVEAANCIAFDKAFAHRQDVAVPKVYQDVSTPRVLTMSFEEGVYVNDVTVIRDQMRLKTDEIAKLVAEVFAEQIFVHGRVHCDPHFANMLVRPMPSNPRKPQLILLDHGLYRTLNHELRLNYAKLWRSIIFGDEAGIKKFSARMNAGDMYQLWASMLTTKSFDKVLQSSEDLNSLRFRNSAADRESSKKYAREYADDIGVVLRKVPRELLLILKTNDCLRNVDLALGHPVNNFVISARYIQRAINEERYLERPSWLTSVYNALDSLSLEARLQAVQQYVSWLMWWRR